MFIRTRNAFRKSINSKTVLLLLAIGFLAITTISPQAEEDVCSVYEAAQKRETAAANALAAAKTAHATALTKERAARKSLDAAKKGQEDYYKKAAELSDARDKTERGSEEWIKATDEVLKHEWSSTGPSLRLSDARKAFRAAYKKTDSLKVDLDKAAATAKKLAAETAPLKAACDKKKAEEKAKKDAEEKQKKAEEAAKNFNPRVHETGFVTTDCIKCETLASMVNDVVGSIKTLSKALPEAEAKLRSNTNAQKILRAEQKENWDAISKVARLKLKAQDAKMDVAPYDKALSRLSFESIDIESELSDLFFEQSELEETIASYKAELKRLKPLEIKLRKQLGECEKQCKLDAEKAQKLADEAARPVVPPYQEKTTDCPPCAAIASQINDVRGTLVGKNKALAQAQVARTKTEGALQKSKEALAKLKTDISRQSGAVLSERDKVKKAALRKEFHKMLDDEAELESTISKQEKANTKALAAERALQKEIKQLNKLETDLLIALKACEKQCKPGGGDPKVGLGDKTNGPGVTTDCVKCETLASLLNDIIGSISTTENDLKIARADLKVQLAKTKEIRAAIKAAEKAFGDALSKSARQKAAGEDNSKAHKEYKDQLQKASDLLWDKDDALSAQFKLQTKVGDLEDALAGLKKQEKTTRAALAECEKTCKKPVQKPIASLPETDGTAKDDCDDCETAKTKLGETQQKITDLKERIRKLEDEIAKLVVQEAEQIQEVKDCFKVCGKTTSIADPEKPVATSTVMEQPKECDAGKKCKISYKPTTEQAEKLKSGGILKFNVPTNSEDTKLASCSAASGGGSVCSLRPGNTGADLSGGLPVSLTLSKSTPNGKKVCVSAGGPDPENKKELVQAIQHGLNMMGIDVGKADGAAGPKTRAGIATFAKSHDDLDPTDLKAVYRKLYGVNGARPKGKSEDCIKLVVKGGQTGVKKKKKKSGFNLKFGPRPKTLPRNERD